MPHNALRGNLWSAGFFPAGAAVLSLVLATPVMGGSAAAQVQQERRLPETQLQRELRQEGFVVKVTTLLVEPVMGFLIGRGFPTPEARRYAATCVIHVAISNESAPARISYDLRSWRSRRPDGTISAPQTREYWMQEWQTSPLSNVARMGFEWAQLPTQQELDNGDSTQGMVNTGLPAGSQFDLLLEWICAGKIYRNSLKEIDCAPPS